MFQKCFKAVSALAEVAARAAVGSGTPVSAIAEADVRRWRRSLVSADINEVTVAKAYRLLKAVVNTALDDGLIRRNPCRIKGAGQEAPGQLGAGTGRG